MSDQTLRGQLMAAGGALPEWAQAHLYIALRDRDDAPENPMTTGPVSGPQGTFALPLDPEAAIKLALPSHRDGPHHLATLGWDTALNPALAELPWQASGILNWDGAVTLTGYVEQLHLLEWGGLPLAVLELAGWLVPHTYRRLPPLPLPVPGDRHHLHADRHLHDSPEQAYYLLADADSPLTALAQDALVSNLRVVAFCSLGEQAAGWHELVNIPLVLDSLTLIGP
ncbi:MAG: hypothetical protein Kow0077_20960 [Anaerolineae bacterium]